MSANDEFWNVLDSHRKTERLPLAVGLMFYIATIGCTLSGLIALSWVYA
jgi:hypothetical protein